MKFKMYLKKILNKIKNVDYKSYFKTSIIFFTFIITNLINSSILRMMTVKNYFDYKPILGDLAFLVIIGSIGYIFKTKKRFRYYFFCSILFTAICVINSMYYSWFMSFSSVSLLATSLQVVDVGDAVVQQVLKIQDFIYLWQPIVFFLINRKLKSGTYYKEVAYKEIRKKRGFHTLIVGAIILTIFILNLTSLEIGRLSKQWNRDYIVQKFGIYIYHVNDLVKSLEPKFSTLFGYDKAFKEFREFYDENTSEKQTNKYTDIFKGKNVIVVHTESMQNIAMTTSFNGQEVTPNLNRIASEGLYFSNFYSQVSVGTSSDAEFTFNTSLLPVNNGTVFISYFDRYYYTMPKMMKEQNYKVVSMHGNNGSFWNRDVMHKNLGYDKFYSKSSYDIDDVIGLGISDKSFFRQSTEKLKELKEKDDNPFYATLIMLSNHTPFDEVDKYGEFPVTMNYETTDELGNTITNTANYMEGTSLGNYFKSAHYADGAIGEFMIELDEADLLDNTIVVFYGDHDAKLPKKDYNLMNNYDPENDKLLDENDLNYDEFDYYDYELNRKVPFIIWSKDIKHEEITTAMGMYDVLPTLSNMLGVYNKYQLGHDIMNLTDNLVPFPNGNWLTNKVFYNNSKEEYIPLTTEPINEEYISDNISKSEQLLKISNDIIVYDLIKSSNDKEKEEE